MFKVLTCGYYLCQVLHLPRVRWQDLGSNLQVACFPCLICSGGLKDFLAFQYVILLFARHDAAIWYGFPDLRRCRHFKKTLIFAFATSNRGLYLHLRDVDHGLGRVNSRRATKVKYAHRLTTSSLQPQPAGTSSATFFIPEASHNRMTISLTALTSSTDAPPFKAPLKCPFNWGFTFSWG